METRMPLWRNISENPQPLVFGLCVIALAVFIGAEVWTSARAFLYRPAATQHASTSTNTTQPASEQISAANLFGRAANEGNLPETSLQVTLRAVFAAADPRQASAVIETADGRAQVIKVGASVANDATLQEVHENRIVLAHNGSMETLYFPAPQESTDFSIAQNTAPVGSEVSAEQEAAPDNAPPAGASPDEIKRAAILQRLEELRARSSR